MNIIVITSTYTVSGSKSIIVSNTLSFAIARLHFYIYTHNNFLEKINDTQYKENNEA